MAKTLLDILKSKEDKDWAKNRERIINSIVGYGNVTPSFSSAHKYFEEIAYALGYLGDEELNRLSPDNVKKKKIHDVGTYFMSHFNRNENGTVNEKSMLDFLNKNKNKQNLKEKLKEAFDLIEVAINEEATELEIINKLKSGSGKETVEQPYGERRQAQLGARSETKSGDAIISTPSGVKNNAIKRIGKATEERDSGKPRVASNPAKRDPDTQKKKSEDRIAMSSGLKMGRTTQEVIGKENICRIYIDSENGANKIKDLTYIEIKSSIDDPDNFDKVRLPLKYSSSDPAVRGNERMFYASIMSKLAHDAGTRDIDVKGGSQEEQLCAADDLIHKKIIPNLGDRAALTANLPGLDQLQTRIKAILKANIKTDRMFSKKSEELGAEYLKEINADPNATAAHKKAAQVFLDPTLLGASTAASSDKPIIPPIRKGKKVGSTHVVNPPKNLGGRR